MNQTSLKMIFFHHLKTRVFREGSSRGLSASSTHDLLQSNTRGSHQERALSLSHTKSPGTLFIRWIQEGPFQRQWNVNHADSFDRFTGKGLPFFSQYGSQLFGQLVHWTYFTATVDQEQRFDLK